MMRLITEPWLIARYTLEHTLEVVLDNSSPLAPTGNPLSDPALLEEFSGHADIWNREPTALVSASDRIVDTLKRAADKHHKNGDVPPDAWTAFIEVPPSMNESATRIPFRERIGRKVRTLGTSEIL